MAKKFPSRVYAIPKVYHAGPFLGMRDALEPAAASPEYALLLKNCYATNTSSGARAVVSIPGFFSTLTTMGTSGARATQWLGQFTKTTGATKSLAICNGEIWEYDWGANTSAKRISTANLTSASITLSATARIHCLTFFDKLVVSDGINIPFQWDGTSGSGLTSIANCPPIYGQPVSYFSQFFGIKATEPDVIVWSVVGDILNGYESGGYTKAWGLPGTKGERINALAASNDYLGILRPRSTTVVLGAIPDDFETAANRSAVSEQIGAGGSSATVVLDEGVLTVDAVGRPQFWTRGGGYLTDPPLFDACERTVRGIAGTTVPAIEVTLDDSANLIWVGFPPFGQTEIKKHLLFERTGSTPNFVGTVDYGTFGTQRMGVWVDTALAPRVVHAFTGGGIVFVHGTPEGSTWNFGYTFDYAQAGPIDKWISGAHMGADIAEEKGFDEFEIECLLENDATVYATFETPSGADALATSATMTFTSVTGAVWDDAEWDIDVWPGDAVNKRSRIGIAKHGRWLIPTVIALDVASSQFGLIYMQCIAYAESRSPKVP